MILTLLLYVGGFFILMFAGLMAGMVLVLPTSWADGLSIMIRHSISAAYFWDFVFPVSLAISFVGAWVLFYMAAWSLVQFRKIVSFIFNRPVSTDGVSTVEDNTSIFDKRGNFVGERKRNVKSSYSSQRRYIGEKKSSKV